MTIYVHIMIQDLLITGNTELETALERYENKGETNELTSLLNTVQEESMTCTSTNSTNTNTTSLNTKSKETRNEN